MIRLRARSGVSLERVVGENFLELSFSSKFMRDLATEPEQAYNYLGSENGQAFIGLMADFRVALFASDVPGGPRSLTRDGREFQLEWFVSTSCILQTVIAGTGYSCDAWKDAHRILLTSVRLREEMLA